MKKWIKILSVILLFATISVAIYFILKAFGLTKISTIRNIVLKSGKNGIIVYTLITAFMLIFLCFVPLLNTSLAILGIAVFGARTAIITNIIAVFISSSILFLIGDKLGEKFACKLVGKKALNDTQNLIHNKSKLLLPILFILPTIPDEAICLVAGMTKIKYWYLILISLVYHAIEICLFCFIGSGIINWSSLTVLDWIILVNILLIDLYFLFKIEKKLSKND